jgi:hypothetical protein
VPAITCSPGRRFPGASSNTLTTTGKLIPTLTDLTAKVVKSVALGPHDSCRRLTRGSSLDSRSTRQRSPVRDRHWKDEIVATISPTQQIPIHWTYPSVPLGVRGPQSRTQRTGHSRRRLVRVRPRTPWGFKSPRTQLLDSLSTCKGRKASAYQRRSVWADHRRHRHIPWRAPAAARDAADDARRTPSSPSYVLCHFVRAKWALPGWSASPRGLPSRPRCPVNGGNLGQQQICFRQRQAEHRRSAEPEFSVPDGSGR